jgi:hypothetical protein
MSPTSDPRVHLLDAPGEIIRGIHGARSRCGLWLLGLPWTRTVRAVSCVRCLQLARVSCCDCGEDRPASRPLCLACEGLPELGHVISLEVIWIRWGCAYYETRVGMWAGRHARPLFPVAVALGADAWSTKGYEPPEAILLDVRAIRQDFRARTGRELSL